MVNHICARNQLKSKLKDELANKGNIPGISKAKLYLL